MSDGGPTLSRTLALGALAATVATTATLGFARTRGLDPSAAVERPSAPTADAGSLSGIELEFGSLASEPPIEPDPTFAHLPDIELESGTFVPGRAGFAVRFRDIVTPYRVFLLTAVPGERVRLGVVDGPLGRGRYSLEANAGSVDRLSEREWAWNAPDREGTYRLVFRRESSSGTGSGKAGAGRPAPDAITLNAVVMVPLDEIEDGTVHGYRVGDFPQKPYRDLPQYLPPRGFIPLTPDGDLQVSPHFTLAQFPCKGPPGFPKYVVLSEKLLLKLELLLEEANRAGVEAPTFQVLSGFRSPWYNAGIGRPRYSRHIYGDAADIYVDKDADGRMDDLNGDGRINLADATVLHRIVEQMDGSSETAHLIGGLGQYPTTPNHGPFIHVDTREYRARW